MKTNVYDYLKDFFGYLEDTSRISSVTGKHSLVIDGEANWYDCKIVICDRPACQDFFILVFNRYLGLIRQIVLDYHYVSEENILEDSEYYGVDLNAILLPCDFQGEEPQWKKDCKIMNSCGNCYISWELPTPEEITIPLEFLAR